MLYFTLILSFINSEMNTFAFIFIIFTFLTVNSWNQVNYKKEFELFLKENHKTYKTLDEKSFRYEIWKRNCELIDKHNNETLIGLHSFSMKMNHLGDLVCFVDYGS